MFFFTLEITIYQNIFRKINVRLIRAKMIIKDHCFNPSKVPYVDRSLRENDYV